MDFKVIKKSAKSLARLGLLETDSGVIETPCLVPVATQAVIKTLDSKEVLETKSQILICNTFHLHLKPGEDLVKNNGGLHKFMNWSKPLMTDSGGFQVFSLGFGRDFGTGKILKKGNPSSARVFGEAKQPKSLKITDDGVYFQSPLDGKKLFIGPKESIKIQEKLGADIIFVFDECTSPLASWDYIEKSLEKTHKWAEICLTAHSAGSGQAKKSKQALYGIVQGGRYKDLRKKSAKFIGAMDFDGFGIGGEFGDNKKDMAKMINWVVEELPEEKPRHLLGIGYLEDIKVIIKEGIDTFDCTVPTHYARRGIAFIHPPKFSKGKFRRARGKLNLNKSVFLKDKTPLDKNCSCYVCRDYSRAYICHLLRAHELTALKLLTFHNLYFFNSFIEKIRQDIKDGKI